MTTRSAPQGARSLSRVTKGSSAAVTLIGGLGLVGWVFDIPAFTSVLPGFVTMHANTALALVVAGVSLWLLGTAQAKNARALAAVGATLVALMGLLTLSQYLFGWDLGLDELLFKAPRTAVATSPPGRMTPATALNFFLSGTALLIFDTRRGFRLAQALTLAVGAVSLIALAGWLYGVPALSALGPYPSMAVHTALACLLLCLGILSARPDRGVIRVLAGPTLGGVMGRRLAPAAILVPLVLGWVTVWGARAGFYRTEFGLALFAVSTIVVFIGLVLWSASLLARMDARHRQAEERFRLVVEAAPNAMLMVDKNRKITLINKRTETLFGYAREELIGQEVEMLIPERFRAKHPGYVHGFFQAPKARAMGAGRDLFGRKKDGTEVSIEIGLSPAGTSEDLFTIASIIDITERKHMEEERTMFTAQLAAANQELEAFSYSVSHDLRAPLRAIDGFSRILLEDHAGKLDEEGQRVLTVIRSSTQKMGTLIDDLLAFSRLGRQQIVRSDVNMETLVKEAIHELRPASPERVIRFNVNPLPAAVGDRAMIRQAVVNLLSNAVKYTRPRTAAVIEVGSRQEEGEAIYYVKDNGVGFDMQYVHKLFGVFQRLHRQEEFEGTGVGLAIVQRVIHRHGGRVWAEGKLNEGATFSFSLPKAGGAAW